MYTVQMQEDSGKAGRSFMYKKWLLAVLALVIICICSSCASFAPLYERLVQDTFSSYTQIEQYDYVAREGYSYKPATFGYSALDSQEQQVYQQLEKAVYQISERADSLYGSYPIQTIQTDASFSEARFYKVAAAFEIDHPQVFWLDGVYVCQDYAQGRSFQMYSHLSAEACNQAQARFHRQLRNIVELVPQGLSEYERELFLHDYIIDSCTYVDDGEWSRYSPYGAIVNKQAVCEGYSEALQLLFSCVGIESCVLFGEYENEAHEWNLVKINGEWYHLDATWNDMDQDVSEADDHLYFNISDAVIESNDHTIAPLYSSMTEEDVCNADEEYIALFNLLYPGVNLYNRISFIKTVRLLQGWTARWKNSRWGKWRSWRKRKRLKFICCLIRAFPCSRQTTLYLNRSRIFSFPMQTRSIKWVGKTNWTIPLPLPTACRVITT